MGCVASRKLYARRRDDGKPVGSPTFEGHSSSSVKENCDDNPGDDQDGDRSCVESAQAERRLVIGRKIAPLSQHQRERQGRKRREEQEKRNSERSHPRPPPEQPGEDYDQPCAVDRKKDEVGENRRHFDAGAQHLPAQKQIDHDPHQGHQEVNSDADGERWLLHSFTLIDGWKRTRQNRIPLAYHRNSQ